MTVKINNDIYFYFKLQIGEKCRKRHQNNKCGTCI